MLHLFIVLAAFAAAVAAQPTGTSDSGEETTILSSAFELNKALLKNKLREGNTNNLLL